MGWIETESEVFDNNAIIITVIHHAMRAQQFTEQSAGSHSVLHPSAITLTKLENNHTTLYLISRQTFL